jgi:hypothetical protein
MLDGVKLNNIFTKCMHALQLCSDVMKYYDMWSPEIVKDWEYEESHE